MKCYRAYWCTINQIIAICDTIKRVPLFWGLITYIGVLIIFDFI